MSTISISGYNTNKLSFRRCVVCKRVALMALNISINGKTEQFTVHDGSCLEVLAKRYPNSIEILEEVNPNSFFQWVLNRMNKHD